MCSSEDDACLLVFGPDGSPQARLASLLPAMAHGKFVVSSLSCCRSRCGIFRVIWPNWLAVVYNDASLRMSEWKNLAHCEACVQNTGTKQPVGSKVAKGVGDGLLTDVGWDNEGKIRAGLSPNELILHLPRLSVATSPSALPCTLCPRSYTPSLRSPWEQESSLSSLEFLPLAAESTC